MPQQVQTQIQQGPPQGGGGGGFDFKSMAGAVGQSGILPGPVSNILSLMGGAGPFSGGPGAPPPESGPGGQGRPSGPVNPFVPGAGVNVGSHSPHPGQDQQPLPPGFTGPLSPEFTGALPPIMGR